MPVENHEIHPSTIGGALYGCHNRPEYLDGYAMLISELHGKTLVQRTAQIPDRLSRDCRYDMSLYDSKCKECRHQGSGEYNANKVIAASKQ